jgi:hypothetical protein
MNASTIQERHALTQEDRDAKRTENIYLILFLEAESSAKTLSNQRNTIYRRNRYKDTTYTDALWRGYCALNDQARNYARQLTEDGKLLFAFAGTTALQGFDL